MTTTQIVIGLDGGGTKTHTVAIKYEPHSEQVSILAESFTGSSNPNSVGKEKAKAEVLAGIFNVIEKIEHVQIMALGIGMSGVDRPSDKEMVSAWILQEEALKKYLAPDFGLAINNDAVAALCSGTLGKIEAGKSVVMISGTGMIVVGMDSKQNFVRVAGWGPLLGDTGSGYSIGSLVLKYVCNLADQVVLEHDPCMKPTITSSLLTEKVLAFLSLKQPSDLIGYVYTQSTEWSKIACLAPVCFECAAQGDVLANNILNYAASCLFGYLDGLLTNKMGITDTNSSFDLVLSGSIVVQEPETLVAIVLKKLIKNKYPNAQVLYPQVSAAVGSALFVVKNRSTANIGLFK